MDTQNTTTITLAGRSFTLTYDDRAHFRYGKAGGELLALFMAGQDYYQTLLLVWSALDDEGLKHFPTADDLVPHIGSHDDALFEPVLSTVIQAGWGLKKLQKQRSEATEANS